MKYKSHLVSATITAVAVPLIAKQAGINFSINELILIMPAIIMGGLFPDIDTASIPSRIYAATGTLLTAYWYYTGNFGYIWILWVPFVMAKMFKHRAWTHSRLLPLSIIVTPFIITMAQLYPLFNLKYTLLLTLKSSFVMVAFAIGIICHLVTDSPWLRKLIQYIGGDKMIKKLYG